MTSPSLAYGLIAAQRHTEKMVLTIRRELKRLGCTDAIEVKRDRMRLRLVRGKNELIPDDPEAVVATLIKTSPPTRPDELWKKISCPDEPEERARGYRILLCIGILLVTAGLVTIFFLSK